MKGRPSLWRRTGLLEARWQDQAIRLPGRYDLSRYSDEELDELERLAMTAEQAVGPPEWTAAEALALVQLAAKQDPARGGI